MRLPLSALRRIGNPMAALPSCRFLYLFISLRVTFALQTAMTRRTSLVLHPRDLTFISLVRVRVLHVSYIVCWYI